jgi:hypothetical protein
MSDDRIPVRRRSMIVTAWALATAALTVATGALPASARIDSDPVPTDTRISAVVTSLIGTIQGVRPPAIERGHVRAALTSAHADLEPAAAPWVDGPGSVAPASGVFSVAFDDGRGSPSGLPDSFGRRAAVLTPAVGGGYTGAVVDTTGASVVCTVTAATTAAALLAATPDRLQCAADAAEPVDPSTGSAVTTMWAWGNSVEPALDNRGLGQPGMAPAAIASFAREHRLTAVYLSVPWASDQGAIATWLHDCVEALHAEGVSVAALGGDSGWLDDPALVARWVSDARAAADFDAIQLDVEPWAGVADPDFSTITPRMTALLGSARAAAGPLPVGLDLPWWVARVPHGEGTAFDALVRHVDTVAIVAFADHASGAGGIVTLAGDAVRSAARTGTPFTVGVETDTPAVAGGADFTFFDEGPVALETEVAKVRSAFRSVEGYRGVTVEHMLAWSALIDAG